MDWAEKGKGISEPEVEELKDKVVMRLMEGPLGHSTVEAYCREHNLPADEDTRQTLLQNNWGKRAVEQLAGLGAGAGGARAWARARRALRATCFKAASSRFLHGALRFASADFSQNRANAV